MLEGGKVMAEGRKFHLRIFNMGVFLEKKKKKRILARPIE